jgi:hypothetical protein
VATTSEITDIIKAQIQKFEGRSESVDVGTVVEIGDGIARIHGLAACLASELLDFGNNVFGLAFNLEEDTVSAIILGDYTASRRAERSAPPGASSRRRWASSSSVALSTRSRDRSTERVRSIRRSSVRSTSSPRA